ncbi:MAG: hypothetical protein LUE87_10170 [Lachnospiraceae bacterium]|nr:hypothetical protein [Lachnospiraceae bacterium]
MKRIYLLGTVLLAAFILTSCGKTNEGKLTEPPELTISYGGETYSVLKGGYSWTYENGNGKYTSTVADAAHPLQCQELFSPIYIRDGSLTVTLNFEVDPDTVLVRCWSDEYWDDFENAVEEDIDVDDMAFELKTDGGYIYQIVGTWDSFEGYKGVADYSFYVLPDGSMSGAEETDSIDLMVMVNGILYCSTGQESTMTARYGMMDGEIASSVGSTEIPSNDNQSNFGTGYGYQYGLEGTIEVYMDGKWIVFESG